MQGVLRAVKIITNFILVAVPSINVKGAPIGTVLCYVFLFFTSMYILCKQINMVPSIQATFLKPFAASVFCAAAAIGSYSLLSNFISEKNRQATKKN